MPYRFQNTSVVLASSSPIETRTVEPEALRRSGVVPESRTVTSRLITPPLAIVQYDDGLTIQVTDTRCIFQKPITNIHDMARDVLATAERYADATKLTPYSAVGINWGLRIEGVPSPFEWLREHLMQGVSMLADYRPTVVQLTKDLPFASSNVNFRVDGGQLICDCNYHFTISDRGPAEVADALKNWSHCRDHLTEMAKLFRE